jgi:peptide/nickel transport system substrate-binding protein
MRIRNLLLTTFVCLLACGCDTKKAAIATPDSSDSGHAIGTMGGKIVLSSRGGPKTFNPIVENEASSSEFTGMVFQGLVDLDPVKGLPRAALAERWESDSSGKVYTFHLRPGLKFNDGSPLTADDVVFTWKELAFHPKVMCAMRDILMVDGKLPEVKALDSLTVEFRLPTIFGPFVAAAGGLPVLSRKRLGAKTGEPFNAVYGLDTPPDSIVGAGPYKLARYEGGQRGVFVRNPYYWKFDAKGQRLPYLDTVLMTIVQDQKAEVLKFKAGEIDAMDVQPADFPVLKPLEAEGKFKIHRMGPSLNSFFLIFNQNTSPGPDGKPLIDPVKLAWFRDRNFRVAVSFAIERKAIRDIVWNGLGHDANGPQSPSTGYWWNAKLPPLVQNLDSARLLLKESGFTWDAQGKLHDSKGNPVKFTLVTNAENQSRIETAGLVRKDLEKIGIDIVFTQIEFNALVAKLDGTNDWECVMLGFSGGGSDPHFGANVWVSTGRTHQWFPRQKSPSTPWEKELDSLVAAGVKSTDTAARKKTYDRLQAVVREEQPLIFLGHYEALGAIRTKFGNVNPTPLGGILHNLDELFVRP